MISLAEVSGRNSPGSERSKTYGACYRHHASPLLLTLSASEFHVEAGLLRVKRKWKVNLRCDLLYMVERFCDWLRGAVACGLSQLSQRLDIAKTFFRLYICTYKKEASDVQRKNRKHGSPDRIPT